MTSYEEPCVTDSGMVNSVESRGHQTIDAVEPLVWYTAPFSSLNNVVLPFAMLMLVILDRPKKTSKLVRPMPMVTEVNLEHKLNALVPIDVTASGMVTEVNWVHDSNALIPIDVTASGMVTEVKLKHKENAPLVAEPLLIMVTESGMVTDAILDDW